MWSGYIHSERCIFLQINLDPGECWEVVVIVIVVIVIILPAPLHPFFNILKCRSQWPVAYPGILLGGGGGLTNSVEDRGQRERGSGGGSHLLRGSGGSCNLVQEISFPIVKFS